MPLKSFHGSYLKVPPQPADQAEELVAAGDFGSYEIAFPEGGWDLNDLDDFQLLSLDELETCNRRWAAAADAVTNGRLAVCQRPA